MPAGLEVTTPSPPLLAWMVRLLSTAAAAALGSVGLGVSWHPWWRASAAAKARRTAKPTVRRGGRICVSSEKGNDEEVIEIHCDRPRWGPVPEMSMAAGVRMFAFERVYLPASVTELTNATASESAAGPCPHLRVPSSEPRSRFSAPRSDRSPIRDPGLEPRPPRSQLRR